jgi:hypothetical protein
VRSNFHLDKERVMKIRLTVIALVLTPSIVFAQSIHGVVVEQTSGSRVPHAGIVLLDASGHTRNATLADSAGEYRITAPTPGVYSLSVQGRGLAPIASPKITLTPSSDEEFNAILALGAKALPTVVVKDKSIVHPPPGNPHKYDEFLMRRKLGFGHFITRADIESRPQTDSRTLYTKIPGVKYWQNGSEWYLRSDRCSAGLPSIGGRPSDPIPPTSAADPVVFVDGLQVSRRNGLDELRSIPPNEIEAIEVFQGLSEMPGQLKGDACFVIFIWRR